MINGCILPALKRVKRISSRNKSGPFMGSEFAYEDLSSFELGKYTFNYIEDAKIEGVDTFVLEQVPTDKNSGYTMQKGMVRPTILPPSSSGVLRP